jgi:hypothetical protein
VKKLLTIGSVACAVLTLSLPVQARPPGRSCSWSITAACAAWRNGSYTRDGITHEFVGRKPNGRMIVHVYRGNTRVK